MSLEQAETVPLEITGKIRKDPKPAPLPPDHLNILQRWQPTGYRVSVKTPFISDDAHALFAIQITPFLPMGPIDYNAKANHPLFMIFNPIFPDPSHYKAYTEDPPIVATRYANPPLLGILAHYYRFWRGSLKYRIRTISSFVSSGCIYTGILRHTKATKLGKNDNNFMSFTNRYVVGAEDPYNVTSFAHMVIDPSMFRHMEIEVPFDELVDFKEIPKEVDHEASSHSSYLVFYNIGTLSTGGDRNSVVTFEIDICAGDDFNFYNYMGPPYLNANDLSFHTDPFMYPVKANSKDNDKDETNGINLVNKNLSAMKVSCCIENGNTSSE